MASKVTLRQKELKGNKLSLYLDFWPPITDLESGKKTRREFLSKYIYAPIRYKEKRTRGGKTLFPIYSDEKTVNEELTLHNENELRTAEEIRRQWENKLSKPEIYDSFELEQLKKNKMGKQDFLKYFISLAEKRTGLNHDNWIAASKYLERFTAGNLKFADINEKVCNDFREFLLTTKSNKSIKTTLSNNSAASYYNKFKATVRQAYIDGYLTIDLNKRIKSIKENTPAKSFLTIEELNKLVKTNCNNPLLKKAALFSALTGLRFSDIQKLKWKEIQHSEDHGYYISFIQKKTRDPEEMLNIPDQAFSLLGDPGDPEANVFEGLTYSAYSNKHLYQWIGAAGITKDITFHSFRHTFATLQLAMGTDIYTVSNLLGHKSLKTTQIYARIINKTKREAAGRIKLEL